MQQQQLIEQEVVEQNRAAAVSRLPETVDPNTALLQVIERIAMSPDADLDKLEKMLDMQERVLNRNAKQAFAAAFAAMQADIPEIVRLGTGHNSVKYATFEDINEAVKPILKEHGFGISFRFRQDNNMIRVIGILSHCEGHSEETEMLLPADGSGNKNAVHAIGSSTSYGKRYVLCALLNISTRGEDDDGKAAGSVKVSPFQAKTLLNVLLDCSESTQEWFAGKFGDVAEVRKDEFAGLLEQLKKARDKYKGSSHADA